MTSPHPGYSLPQMPKMASHPASRVHRADSGFVESSFHRPSSDTARTSLSNEWKRPSEDHSQPTAPCANDKLTQFFQASKEPDTKESSQSSTHHKSDGRRPSIVSSSNSTTASKPRHRSRPSSHRSSRHTLVIHQARRPKLRGSQTMPPLPTRDVDDVLALHHRSCTLFRSVSTADHPAASGLGVSHADSRFRPVSASAVSLSPSAIENEHDEAYPSEYAHVPPTTIHWTSPGTRRREYEEIDRSCRGFRGLFSKIAPRWGASKPTRFYDDAASDKGSVRRYRIDLPEEEEEEARDYEKKDEEHESGSTANLRGRETRRKEKEGTPKVGKRWGCF